MHVLLFGASRNIGYFVAQRLLAKGNTCTLLLRKPDAMESDSSMKDYIQNGSAKLVRGDALVREDVQKAVDVANADGKLELIFFGIGQSTWRIYSQRTRSLIILQAATQPSRSQRGS
jgi:NAD(P)-dependent dehydrogenase (short-subunit alcohol dehydrogenase family)